MQSFVASTIRLLFYKEVFSVQGTWHSSNSSMGLSPGNIH